MAGSGLPRHRGSQLSQSGWGARHPARANSPTAPSILLCTCMAPQGAAHRGGSAPGLPTGCWLGGCEPVPAQVDGACPKSSPRLFGPHTALPQKRRNVRAAPSARWAPAAVQGWATETVCSSQVAAEELERMAPTLAGRRGGVCHAGSHGQLLCGIWAPGPCSAHTGSLLGSELPPLLTPALASR